MTYIAVEICVTSVDSALAAEAGGASRVELCEYLEVGGVTPSAGAIAVACRRLRIKTHVLVRPREGDFAYSDLEFEVMMRDVEIAKELGAAGVVLGVLERKGSVDRERTAKLAAIARPMTVTFHKAFDSTRDPSKALDDLIELGIDRVLTSGAGKTALDGLDRLAWLVERSGGRIVVMPGGSITEAGVGDVVRTSRAREVHLGSAACSPGSTTVDAERVRRIVRAANGVLDG